MNLEEVEIQGVAQIRGHWHSGCEFFCVFRSIVELKCVQSGTDCDHRIHPGLSLRVRGRSDSKRFIADWISKCHLC